MFLKEILFLIFQLEVMSEESYFQNIFNIKRFSAINGFKALRRPRALEDDLSME